MGPTLAPPDSQSPAAVARVEIHSWARGMARIHQLIPRRLRVGSASLHSLIALLGVQVATYLVPAIQIPYLTRVLGPSAFGALGFAVAFSVIPRAAVEYGFSYSGTAEIARLRNTDPEVVPRAYSAVMTAKMCLLVATLLVAFACYLFVPQIQAMPLLFWSTLCAGLVQAFSLVWLFQGFERTPVGALIDVGSRLLAIIPIFIVVNGPSDAARVSIVQAIAALGAVGVQLVYVARRFGCVPKPVDLKAIRRSLSGGFSMFFFRVAIIAYTTGNAFLLGLMTTSVPVAMFVVGERICRLFNGMLQPIGMVTYPKITGNVEVNFRYAQSVARRGLLGSILLGCILSASLIALSPVVVSTVAGSQYNNAVPVLRTLGALPILVGVNEALGIQWLVATGRAVSFNAVIVLGGTVNVALALLLVPIKGALGMALSVTVSEAIVAICFFSLAVGRRNDSLFSLRPRCRSTSSLLATNGVSDSPPE